MTNYYEKFLDINIAFIEIRGLRENISKCICTKDYKIYLGAEDNCIGPIVRDYFVLPDSITEKKTVTVLTEFRSASELFNIIYSLCVLYDVQISGKLFFSDGYNLKRIANFHSNHTVSADGVTIFNTWPDALEFYGIEDFKIITLEDISLADRCQVIIKNPSYGYDPVNKPQYFHLFLPKKKIEERIIHDPTNLNCDYLEQIERVGNSIQVMITPLKNKDTIFREQVSDMFTGVVVEGKLTFSDYSHMSKLNLNNLKRDLRLEIGNFITLDLPVKSYECTNLFEGTKPTIHFFASFERGYMRILADRLLSFAALYNIKIELNYFDIHNNECIEVQTYKCNTDNNFAKDQKIFDKDDIKNKLCPWHNIKTDKSNKALAFCTATEEIPIKDMGNIIFKSLS